MPARDSCGPDAILTTRAVVAYRDTIEYLLEQNNSASTWTICTGSQGDIATYVVPAMTQGALFSVCRATCSENAVTNVRFNEVYLGVRVEVDKDAAQHSVTSASSKARAFGSTWWMILKT